jgi:hypothetical protein
MVEVMDSRAADITRPCLRRLPAAFGRGGLPMTNIPLPVLALLMGGATCAVLGGYVTLAMIGQVNRKLPDDKQISYLAWHYWKQRRVLSEYKRLYPKGRLDSAFFALLGLMFLFLVATVFTMVVTSPAFR